MSPRGFEASQRPLVWIRSRISPSASAVPHGFWLSWIGHVPVGHLAVRDPVRADDPGEADVDHAALGLHVQPDAEAAEEDGRTRQQPDRPDRRRGAGRPVPARDPDAPSEQVEQRRIGERSAPEDLALVEEAKRDREREQREEVEVAQRERAPQVREADEEGGAEAEPEPHAVDRLAAEGAGAAARHRPRDLRPGPRLLHRAGVVVHLAEHDLPGVARPGLHDPLVGRRPVFGVGLSASAGSGRASRRPSGSAAGSRSPAPRSAARLPRRARTVPRSSRPSSS